MKKMDEYPDPDEEYELLYQEEMEAMREMEEEAAKEQYNLKLKRSKNSLSFDSPSADKENVRNEDYASQSNATIIQNSKKRILSSESLVDITSDLEFAERPAKKHKSDAQVGVPSHESGTTSLRIPKWPFLSVSTDLGEKLYVKINHNSPNSTSSYSANYNNSSGLLVTPYSKLKDMAEETLTRSKTAVVDVEENSVEESDLWVEKYKPKTYFDLLSDEAVNRTLLNWFKMWDKVVFNKEVKLKQVTNNDNSVNFTNELDKDGRPHYKIALLCGPPGLGKTTLAHLVARIAGYNVIEVNASDERTIEALKTKLEAATQIQSVMGNRKPYCLVLDEIDGAPGPTVDFLLNYLNGKTSEKAKRGKKEKQTGTVKRPVVCICNELYTPSLRQLRQQAFVVHFPQTSSSKLAQRLLEICRKQDIKTDLSTLTLLCDKAENDIRSCISTLYFFKNKNGKTFKSADVIKSAVGQKDVQKGIFNMWKEIFQVPMKRGNFFTSLIDRGKEDEVSAHINYNKKAMDKLKHVVHMFQSFGDYDRLLQGVFENFPKSRFSSNVHSLALALEWFSWFDLLDSSVKKEQNFILMPYLPYGFAAWHWLFSSNSFMKITYPSTGYENHVKEMRCKQILNDVLRGLNASMRSYNPWDAVLLDVLPMFNVILVPNIRAINPTLFNESEKKEFKHLVDVMIEYGLNFIQQRSTEGSYCYYYDPNIDDLSRFSDSTLANPRSFPYIMKQVISHEIELERLRRTEEHQTSIPNNADCNKGKPRPETDIQKKTTVKPVEKITEENEMQYTDFFGRIVKVKSTPAGGKAMADINSLKSPVWFSFKEGYSNAIKKDITIEDIL